MTTSILSRNKLKVQFGFYDMLTPDGYNPKLKKGRARGYSSAVLHLAPAKLSGKNVCRFASHGCTAACLNTAGHGGINLDIFGLNAVQRARIARTNMLFDARAQFFFQLVASIEAHVRRALKHGLTPVVRLNGTSDLDWERMPFTDVSGVEYASIMARFPGVQFYDYTKNPARAMLSALGALPANYVITFSRSETNESACRNVLAAGGNVAVVFNICRCKRACKHEIPDLSGLEYLGRRVISGDHDDLRFLDPTGGLIVGLKAKGPAKTDLSGFVVDIRDSVTLQRAA